MNRKTVEALLNDMEIPNDDKKSEGGRIPDNAKYGSWMRKHDPVAFNTIFHDYGREERAQSFKRLTTKKGNRK